VVKGLKEGRDYNALRHAMKVGPQWKAAAECEGFAVPQSLGAVGGNPLGALFVLGLSGAVVYWAMKR
jgi:hypothetical protein